MEKWKKRAVELVASLAFGGRSDMTVVPYYPQKTMINMPEKKFFPRSTPERQGISSKRIYNMLCELENERYANIHTILVLRHGVVISECYSDGYNTNSWHISHSMAKTVCGMVVGTLIDEGKLKIGDKIVDFFPDVEYRDKKFSEITVDHLLSMTSGVDFAEVGAVTDNQWTSTFFSAGVKFAPGSRFSYNSMNSYILARIAERVSGKGFGSLADERIFLPLGIKNYFWEKGPEGTEKGGWGLYLSAESWAKIGAVIASGGVFDGKRILSTEWVENAIAVKAKSGKFNGSFNYAHHMWTAKRGNETLFNGMLGQNVWICPRNDIIVVMLSGNNEIFGASPALEIVRKYLGGRINDTLSRRDLAILREKEGSFFVTRRWVVPKEMNRGLLFRLKIRPRNAFDGKWNEVLGRYAFCNNNVGMMPLIVRTMQNNLVSSIDELSLRREGEALCLDYREGDELFSIRVGFYGYESNIINFRGEYYIVQAMGQAVEDKNGDVEYRIQLIPSETASVRRLTIRKCREGITVELGESPNNRVVENLLAYYSGENRSLALAVGIIERRLGEGAVSDILKRMFNPTLLGVDTSIKDYQQVIERENRRLDEERESRGAIRVFLDHFFKDESRLETSDSAVGVEKNLRKYISEWIDKISGKNQNNREE